MIFLTEFLTKSCMYFIIGLLNKSFKEAEKWLKIRVLKKVNATDYD